MKPNHPNAALLEKLYTCLQTKDHLGMAACYHADARFHDIAFDLSGRQQIHAMWFMIADKTTIHATFTVTQADDETGTADITEEYEFSDTHRPVHQQIHSEFRFRDGLIIEHRDTCDALRWGIQALGPAQGVIAWLIPAVRRSRAMAKLQSFIDTEPSYHPVATS